MKFTRLLYFVAALAVMGVFTQKTIYASPLYDPFLEEFQVGIYGDPDQIAMKGDWPARLFTPAELDLNWLESARQLLFTKLESGDLLSSRLLAQLTDPPLGDVAHLRAAFSQLENPEMDAETWSQWVLGHPFLREEVWTRLFFYHLQEGRKDEARRLLKAWQDLSLPRSSRQDFIWNLRRSALEDADPQISKASEFALVEPWSVDSQLGPFDRSQAWSVWVAHRRAAGLRIIPEHWQGKKTAQLLGSLPRPFFGPEELERSSFSSEWKAALGASLFRKNDLALHLSRYPDPPGDFTAQGWWVKGMRFSSRGKADHYEQLAAREGIFPGWRMDILRRASELRLLKGQWAQGLKNLKLAQETAAKEGGTRSLRRLLRYWNEQALSLALDQDRMETAWQLLDWGDQTFKGESLAVWKEETAHWRALRTGEAPEPRNLGDRAALAVASGKAGTVRPDEDTGVKTARDRLALRGDCELWALWFRWGQALANPETLSGERKTRAISYSQELARYSDSGVQGIPPAAIKAIAVRLDGRPELLGPLFDKILDRDICRLSGWNTTPRPSPVPALLPLLRRSQLDMHAALGIALATGDMRGILAVAYELPGTGLTREEKRRFLYPLPAGGPIREAILNSRTEPALILAVARNESLFEPAVRSRAGALGWMQIMPFHFEGKGARQGQMHWARPAVSIGQGDLLLEENRSRYGGDPYLVLAAYNAGPGAADRWLRQLGGEATRDIYLAWIGYTETRRYVEKVLIDREIYDWIIAGSPE